MASTNNGSGRPPGCVSIPVEIIREPSSTDSGSRSRHNSPFRTFQNDNPYGRFSDSMPWGSNSLGRFQPRQTPSTAYDRVITNSQFNRPFNERPSYQPYQEPQHRQPQQQSFESSPFQMSRSSEDLLSSPLDSIRYNAQPQYSSLIPPSFTSGFRTNSDFVQPNKYSSPLGRSYDALNDYADINPDFPTFRQHPFEQREQQPNYRSTYQTHHQPKFQQQQANFAKPSVTNPNIIYTNEYGRPTDPHQSYNTSQRTRDNTSNDRSRSPASQRGTSPAPSSMSTSQWEEEPELKMAKDTEGPIPMPAPASSPGPTTDQQVPSTDTSTSTSASSPSQPVRDSNTIALEKLEQIKQSLNILEQQVDAFIGSTRHDSKYKGLDEQALKLMMRCDELVDVSADIKEKRREMIRKVESVIAKLESKVPSTPAVEQTSNPMKTANTFTDESPINNNDKTNEENHGKNDEENIQNQASPRSSPPKEDTTDSIQIATEQPVAT